MPNGLITYRVGVTRRWKEAMVGGTRKKGKISREVEGEGGNLDVQWIWINSEPK